MKMTGSDEEIVTVTRRRVLYIPGYDPIPPRRYRELYRKEGTEQAEISGYQLQMGKRVVGTGFGWGIKADFPDGSGDVHQVETDFEVMVWSDVVSKSMGQSIASTYWQLVSTAWVYIGSGALSRLARLRKAPVLTALYPIVMLIGQAILAALLAGLAIAFLPPLAGIPLGAALFYGTLRLFKKLDGRFFAYYLMHDYAFTASLKGRYPEILEDRLKKFSERLSEVQKGGWDEILIVGHSSGAYLAISLMADMIRKNEAGPKLSLLTLGHVVPMAAFLPEARRLRGDLTVVSGSHIPWVDVSAPGDACCFGLCDPVSTSGADPEKRNGPLILSAAFTKTLSKQRLSTMKHRWFRLHFQYLCAFDQPLSYDYFAITAGPRTLADRFAYHSHSPGRISHAAAPYQDREGLI